MGNIEYISGISRLLRYLLLASVVMSTVSIASNYGQYSLLQDFKNGVYASDAIIESLANQNDLRQQIVGIAYFVVFALTVVVFCVWIFRMNKSVRAMGAEGLRQSPGWAVGWFFVPIANLWKPFQAMVDLWKASKNPSNWRSVPEGGILWMWWASFLIANFVANIAFRMMLEAEEIDEYIRMTFVYIVSDLIYIPAVLIAYKLVSQVYEFQRANIVDINVFR